MDDSLRVIIEGLMVIASDPEDQQRLLSDSRFSPVEYFDFEVFDCLPEQMRCGALSFELAQGIETLYREGQHTLRGLSCCQEQEFFISDHPVVDNWRQRARQLLIEIQSRHPHVWEGIADLRVSGLRWIIQ